MVMAETGSGNSNYHEYIENVYVLSETLDGYEEISRTDGKRSNFFEYSNKENNYYTFSQMVGEINNWIDNNDSQKELCKILDGTGYFQQKKSNYLILAYDGYVFKLSGDISKNEMIQLANSLTLVNEGDLY